jgi:hypothetical protein
MTCHALDAATAVQQPGLKPIHAVEIPPYHYASMFEKN